MMTSHQTSRWSTSTTGIQFRYHVRHTSIVRGDEAPQAMEMTSTNRFQAQLDEFSECVLTGKQPEFPPDDALRNMASVLALYESAHTRR